MAPKSVTALTLSCQSVNVSWTPPTNNGGLPLTGYTVWYGDDDRQQRMVGSVTLVTLEGLAPNTTYNIAVAAKNIIGEGTESQSFHVMTQPRHLGTFVTARALTSDTIMINTTLGIEEGFSNCSLSTSPRRKQIFTPPMKVLQLQPDTQYTVVCDVYDSSSTIIPCIYINTSVLTSESCLYIYVQLLLYNNGNTTNCTRDLLCTYSWVLTFLYCNDLYNRASQGPFSDCSPSTIQ